MSVSISFLLSFFIVNRSVVSTLSENLCASFCRPFFFHRHDSNGVGPAADDKRGLKTIQTGKQTELN